MKLKRKFKSKSWQLPGKMNMNVAAKAPKQFMTKVIFGMKSATSNENTNQTVTINILLFFSYCKMTSVLSLNTSIHTPSMAVLAQNKFNGYDVYVLIKYMMTATSTDASLASYDLSKSSLILTPNVKQPNVAVSVYAVNTIINETVIDLLNSLSVLFLRHAYMGTAFTWH